MTAPARPQHRAVRGHVAGGRTGAGIDEDTGAGREAGLVRDPEVVGHAHACLGERESPRERRSDRGRRRRLRVGAGDAGEHGIGPGGREHGGGQGLHRSGGPRLRRGIEQEAGDRRLGAAAKDAAIGVRQHPARGAAARVEAEADHFTAPAVSPAMNCRDSAM